MKENNIYSNVRSFFSGVASQFFWNGAGYNLNVKELGRYGELCAERHLKRIGCRIIERNFTCPQGEIDLIVTDKSCLIFVEVKTANFNPDFHPLLKVNRVKQKRIIKVANVYIARHESIKLQPRFDVVTVEIGLKGKQIRHYHNAFQQSELF